MTTQKIHITLVGKEPLPVYYPIRQFGPDEIHFLCSSETEAVAHKIIQALPNVMRTHVEIVNPYQLGQISAYCKKVQKKHAQDEVNYNITGGTKIMSIAALEVAHTYQAKAIYTTQENTYIQLSSGEEQPMDVRLDTTEILNLSGHQVQSYDLVKDTLKERLTIAQAVGEFVSQYPKAYASLSNCFWKSWGKPSHMKNLPSSYKLGAFLFRREQDHIMIMQADDTVIFDQEGSFLYDLLFQGRWWEVLVASWFQEAFQEEGRELWANVTFKDETTTRSDVVRNETDILMNDRTQLLFIECKSGKVTQDDIYKLERVTETYGGDKSHGLLVSFHRLNNETLLHKGKEGELLIIEFNGKLPNGFSSQQKQLIVDFLSQAKL